MVEDAAPEEAEPKLPSWESSCIMVKVDNGDGITSDPTEEWVLDTLGEDSSIKVVSRTSLEPEEPQVDDEGEPILCTLPKQPQRRR
jgi:hypothetical protein